MIYRFKCADCETVHEVDRPMSKAPGWSLPECSACGGTTVGRDLSRLQFNYFGGYTDTHTLGTPVVLKTKADRDHFHAVNGVTLDRNRYGGKKKVRRASEQVSDDEIMNHLKTHGPIKVPKVQANLDSANRFTIGSGSE